LWPKAELRLMRWALPSNMFFVVDNHSPSENILQYSWKVRDILNVLDTRIFFSALTQNNSESIK
jgi:hypothetical protein